LVERAAHLPCALANSRTFANWRKVAKAPHCNPLILSKLVRARALRPAPSLPTGIPIMCRIERQSDGGVSVVRLSGRIESGDLPELQAQIETAPQNTVLDLREVTLVNREVVGYLVACEARGIELRNCPPYIRAWASIEQYKGRTRSGLQQEGRNTKRV
jgi:hypothetical protein